MKRIIKAPAKINLCLKVNGKRDDGYHDLTMIMQQISLFDTIEFEIISENNFDLFKLLPNFDMPIKLPDIGKIDFNFLNKKFDHNTNKQISIKCNFNYIPTDERNLIYKVVDYIFKEYNIKDKIYIYLNKMIPTSGGLGGGSSDAASMLLFLNKHYKLNISLDKLSEIAAKFGSDIPFFVHNRISLCKGRGEIIKELKPYNNYFILIATPNVRVSTKEIYNRFDDCVISESQSKIENDKINNLLDAINKKNLKKMSDNLFNNLEMVTEPMFEKVAIFKRRILELGAINSLMSGSGPTVFGIFNSYFKANYCKNILKKEHKDSFIYVSRPI